VSVPGAAGPARADQVTITLAANTQNQVAFQALIANFERANPSITINATFALNTALFTLETTELGSGSAPDVLYVAPGCNLPVSICELARDGYLAPMTHEPWTRRSLPFVISESKLHGALYLFLPIVSPMGMFTNDALFHTLGLKVPQTFAHLLSVCQKAKAAGTVAVLLPGGSAISVNLLMEDLAVPNVYAKDKLWPAELKAGSVTFDGTAGWHQALQELST
jgi:ABC-type glycerol-3-phosphate transport system substrate-binding protein